MIQVLRTIISVLSALCLIMPVLASKADAFYVCTKKGQVPAWVNEPLIKAKRKQGWRCRRKMQFQKTPRARTSANNKTPNRTPNSARAEGAKTSANTGPAGRRDTYEPYILEASERYSVPANLIRAVIRVESNYNPNAISSAGAKGLMQLMPGTAKDMAVSDIFDPRQNIFGGTRYIRLLINKFGGDPKLAIAAYHAGPGVVATRGDIPYEATRRYVRSVLEHYLRYKRAKL
jgi:soluble lytic murein transglycosylase-like protein